MKITINHNTIKQVIAFQKIIKDQGKTLTLEETIIFMLDYCYKGLQKTGDIK